MKASFVCLAVLIAIVSANKHWANFRSAKKYASQAEEEYRKKHFLANDNDINAHNEKFKKGQTSYQKGHNHLSDLSSEEKSVLNGARNKHVIASPVAKRSVASTCYRFNSSTNLPCLYNYTLDASVIRPASLDLRTTGWTESVRSQGSCGSCWAFSSSSVNSFYQFNKTKANVVLSPQNLVNCDGTYGAKGCGGGSAAVAFQYFVQQKQNLETDIPYKGVQSVCSRPANAATYAIQGLVQVSMGFPSQAALEQAIYKLGAISVSVHADGLFYYLSGVWDGTYVEGGVSKKCDAAKINHAVTAIGYGYDSTAQKNYWLIKNSWGTGWGEKGYFRMIRSAENLCGIYSYAYGVY